MASMTLQERLHAMLSEQGPRGPVHHCQGQVPGEDGLTGWERDLLDWGFVYGAAFALARLEEPFEREEDVVERAVAPARAAWDRWSAEFRSRPGGMSVARAAESVVCDYSNVAGGHVPLSEMDASVRELADAIGEPLPAASGDKEA